MDARLFRIAYGWMALLFALDILTTQQALAAGAHEVNPLMAPLFHDALSAWLTIVLLIALKAFAWIVAILLTKALRASIDVHICAQFLLPAWALACLGMTVIVAHNWLLAH